MKKNALYIILIYAVLLSCNGAQNDDEQKEISTDLVSNPITASSVKGESLSPEITFENNTYDFGQIIQGEKVTHSFKFDNTGNAELIISDVSASCGCTVPSWSKQPIPVGESGEINVVFDSNGREGQQNKDITVITNGVPSTRILHLKGEVANPANN